MATPLHSPLSAKKAIKHILLRGRALMAGYSNLSSPHRSAVLPFRGQRSPQVTAPAALGLHSKHSCCPLCPPPPSCPTPAQPCTSHLHTVSLTGAPTAAWVLAQIQHLMRVSLPPLRAQHKKELPHLTTGTVRVPREVRGTGTGRAGLGTRTDMQCCWLQVSCGALCPALAGSQLFLTASPLPPFPVA